MIQFILNNKEVKTADPPASTLLDFIRYNRRLTGTKIGCREGDCGACTVLVGSLENEKLVYRQVTSCLMPLAQAAGKHILTIEGLNNHNGLNLIQESFAEENATQCGFCTPGFVVALTGFVLNGGGNVADAIDAMNGNICRCTGYKSIERAAARVVKKLETLAENNNQTAINKAALLPAWLDEIAGNLKAIAAISSDASINPSVITIGGGTDLFVQQHHTIADKRIQLAAHDSGLRFIRMENDQVMIGGGTTVADLAESKVLCEAIPRLPEYIRLISSTPIRNMATVAGNLVNASPIGDLSVFFLAHNAFVILRGENGERTLPLDQFFLDYKKLDLKPGEVLTALKFPLPDKKSTFHFEKVSKRTHLDIASVNAAMRLEMDDLDIVSARISAGGVAPVPLFLRETSAFLQGKKVSAQLVMEALPLAAEEIRPISDARGSAAYKSLLLTQLIKALFMECFPWMPVKMLMPA